MDIVIPYSLSHRWENNELRYCLRSIEKYLCGYDNIYLIGEKPDFVTGIIHIPFANYPRAIEKEKNICDKILLACNTATVSDSFILFNDDFYLLQQICCDQYPNYFYGTLNEKLARIHFTNPYSKTIQNTIDALKNYTKLNYECHYPMVFNKELFKEVMSKVPWGRCAYGYGMRALYGNYFNISSEIYPDCKINETTEQHKIQDRLFFSTGIINEDFADLFERLYPQKSRYEIF